MKKILISFGFVSLILFSQNAFAGDKPAAAASKDVSTLQLPKAKKLNSRELGLLNMVFEDSPQGVLRTRLASNAALQVLKAIHAKTANGKTLSKAEEAEFTKVQVKTILDPIRKFFETIRDHHHLVIPIVEESLGVKRAQTSSILIKFFMTKKELNAFFDAELTNIKELGSACLEFLMVFGDVNANLTVEAQKACDKLIDDLKKQAEEQKKQKNR